METIKLFRLSTGEDVIASCEDFNGDFIVRDPMTILIKKDPRSSKEIIFIDNWLPVQILERNETLLRSVNVISVMEPNKEFIEYYDKCVQDNMEEKLSKETLSGEELLLKVKQEMINMIMESEDAVDTKQLH